MDCVSCLLLGVCWLCGPNFGASERGRALTLEEIKSFFKHTFKPAPQPIAAASRAVDPRFFYMDIGKRDIPPDTGLPSAIAAKGNASQLRHRLREGTKVTMDNFFRSISADSKHTLPQNGPIARKYKNMSTLLGIMLSGSGHFRNTHSV